MATEHDNQILNVIVPGEPKPGGSKRAFLPRGSRQFNIVDACEETKSWQNNVRHFVSERYSRGIQTGPLWLGITFFRRRPKGHFGTGRNADKLKSSAPTYPATRPDVTKLLRSTEDALTGIVWADDAQIVEQFVCKRWGPEPGAQITVETLNETGAA